MAVRGKLDEELVNWDLTRKRFAATALNITTQALIEAARTPNVVTTTETTRTETTTTGTTPSMTTTTTTTTSTTTGPNNVGVAALAQAVSSLLSSVM